MALGHFFNNDNQKQPYAGHGEFKYDLKQGKINEVMIGHHIQDYNGGSGIAFSHGKVSALDFSYEIDGKRTTYELKTDYYCGTKSNNVFIETGNAWGQDSGLTATKADRFIYYLPAYNLVTSSRPADLLNYINSNPQLRKVYGAGENGNSNGILIPLNQFTGAAFLCPRLLDFNPQQ